MDNITKNQIESILECIRMFNAQLERGELLSLVLKKSMEVVGSEAGTLWLLMEDNRLVPVEVQGVKKELMQNLSLKNGEGLAGKVVTNGKPVMVDNVKSEPCWAYHFDEVTGFTTKSILCIPLKVENKTIGCLELVNKPDNGNFTPNDMEMIMYFAGHMAVTLENSRLYSENKQLLESIAYVLISALDAREPFARKHSENVTNISLRIGNKLGLSTEDLKVLEWTALLHDVGKIGINDSVLLQPGSLSNEEWEIIKKHPDIGFKILKKVKPAHFADKISEGVLYHHERYDGKGYPTGLKQDQIPIFSRIVSIADAFDAITSDRPYRKKASMKKALEEIEKCSGYQFDPAITQVFFEVAKEFK